MIVKLLSRDHRGPLQFNVAAQNPAICSLMNYVICKTGEVTQTAVQAEIKVGYDHLTVNVKAEARARKSLLPSFEPGRN